MAADERADGGEGAVDAALIVAAGGGANTAGGSLGGPADGGEAAVIAVFPSAGGRGVDTPPDEGGAVACLDAGTKCAATAKWRLLPPFVPRLPATDA